jgi:hypothetical protein
MLMVVIMARTIMMMVTLVVVWAAMEDLSK